MNDENTMIYYDDENYEIQEQNQRAEYHFEKCKELLFSGKYDEALFEIKKSIDLDGNYQQFYFFSIIYIIKKDYLSAVDALTNCVKLNENFLRAYHIMVICHIYLGDYKKTEENFIKVIECNEKIFKDNDKLIDFENKIENYIKNIYFNDNFDRKEKIIILKLIFYIHQILSVCKVDFDSDINLYFSHYTKLDMLKKLFDKDKPSKFRLNNAIYMNDPEEGKILKKILLNNSSKINFKNFFNTNIENYTYLACFCPYHKVNKYENKSDELPMWVHYGEDCKGINIILDKLFFKNRELYKIQYIDVENFNIYESNKNLIKELKLLENVKNEEIIRLIKKFEKEEIIKDNLKKILKVLQKNDIVENKNEVFKRLVNTLLTHISYLFKDSDYEYENEYRIINFEPYENVLLTDSIIPRLCIEFNNVTKENCYGVIVGPKGNFDDIYAYLKYVGIGNIIKSNINYK